MSGARAPHTVVVCHGDGFVSLFPQFFSCSRTQMSHATFDKVAGYNRNTWFVLDVPFEGLHD